MSAITQALSCPEYLPGDVVRLRVGATLFFLDVFLLTVFRFLYLCPIIL